MGASANCDVLVHALGLGDQPCRPAAGPHFLAGTETRGTGRHQAMDRVWAVVGRGRADQYFPALFSARIGIVALVPAWEERQALAGWSCPGICLLRCHNHTVA